MFSFFRCSVQGAVFILDFLSLTDHTKTFRLTMEREHPKEAHTELTTAPPL